MSGRIRTIKPEILEDERSAGLSHSAWRLWVSTWLLADDHGNLRGDSRRLAAEVFWAVPNEVDITALLDELDRAELIVRYQVNGQSYISIKNWTKHQRIDNAGKPRVPGPNCAFIVAAETRGEIPRLAETLRILPLDPDPDPDPDHLAQRVEHDSAICHSAAQSAPARVKLDFEAVYAEYPRKIGRKRGLAKCKSKITSSAKYERLKRAVAKYAASVAGKDPEYVKHFDTFMGCWEDWAPEEQGDLPLERELSVGERVLEQQRRDGWV